MLVEIGGWDSNDLKEIEVCICVIHWSWDLEARREAPRVVFHRTGYKTGGLVLDEQRER